jgi:hypothetical protein
MSCSNGGNLVFGLNRISKGNYSLGFRLIYWVGSGFKLTADDEKAFLSFGIILNLIVFKLRLINGTILLTSYPTDTTPRFVKA